MDRHSGFGRCGTRIALCALAALFATLAAHPSVAQQNFPSKVIRVVTAGGTGSADTMVRLIFTKLSERTGWNHIVEGHPGADGTIAIGYALNQPADGHTILVTHSTQTVLPSTRTDLKFDWLNGFAPLTRVVSYTPIMMANPKFPPNNLAELIAYSKANPGKLDYSSSTRGGVLHLTAELLQRELGLQWNNFPFSAGGQATTALMSGTILFGITVVSEAAPHVRAGRLKALFVFGQQRSPALPDVQASAEVPGVPQLDVDTWSGLMMKAGTPRELLDRIHGEIIQALRNQEVKDFITRIGGVPVEESQEAFTRKYRADIAQWARVVREAKITF